MSRMSCFRREQDCFPAVDNPYGSRKALALALIILFEPLPLPAKRIDNGRHC